MKFQKGDIIIPRSGATRLSHILRVDGYDEGMMLAHPVGRRGVQHHFRRGEDEYFRLVFRFKPKGKP